MVAPWTIQSARSTHNQKPDTRANAGSSWIPASGRSRTRTWDLFLIRNDFCRLQSPRFALNPCKPAQRRRREGTGEDWRVQGGGPVVAPRRRCEGGASCGPEADITPTIRSSPDAPQARRPGLKVVRTSGDLWRAVGPMAPGGVSDLTRDIQPSASHAASTASLAFRSRCRRGCGGAGAAGDGLAASQQLRASREIRGERPM